MVMNTHRWFGRFRFSVQVSMISIFLFCSVLSWGEISDDPYDEDYVGFNGFCMHENTKIQPVRSYFCSALQGTTAATWEQKLLDITRVAQVVTEETWDWASEPFETTNGVPFSDTWGICVYFEHAQMTTRPLLQSSVLNDAQFNAWIDAMYDDAEDDNDADSWLIGVIQSFGGDYDGYNGISAPAAKASLIPLNKGAKIYFHEYGHTWKRRFVLSDDDYYYWLTVKTYYEYGNDSVPGKEYPSNWNLNVMFYDGRCGLDADDMYKRTSYPFYENNPWYSYRWSEQWARNP